MVKGEANLIGEREVNVVELEGLSLLVRLRRHHEIIVPEKGIHLCWKKL